MTLPSLSSFLFPSLTHFRLPRFFFGHRLALFAWHADAGVCAAPAHSTRNFSLIHVERGGKDSVSMSNSPAASSPAAGSPGAAAATTPSSPGEKPMTLTEFKKFGAELITALAVRCGGAAFFVYFFSMTPPHAAS